MKIINKKWKLDKIPEDVKWVIAWIAISWLFWWPADAYFSLFLKEFWSSYAQIWWLIAFSKFIPLLISIPMWLIADKFSARRLVIWSLVAYLAIPVVFFMAWLEQSIFILLIAIIVNGLMKTVRNIAMDTYIKEKTPKDLSVKVMSVYNWITTWFWWLWLILWWFLVAYFWFHELFLLACFWIFIKLFIFLKVSEVKNPVQFKIHFPQIHKMTFSEKFKRWFTEFFKVDFRVMAMLIVSFFTGATIWVMDVFMVLFIEDLNQWLAIIWFVMWWVYASSFLVLPINKLARRFWKFVWIVIWLLIMAICMSVVALYSESSMIILFAAFFVHMLIFASLVKSTRNWIIAAFTPRHMQWEISWVQNTILVLWNLVWAAWFWIAWDAYWLSSVFWISAFIYLALALFMFYLWIKYEHTVKHVKFQEHWNILTMMHIWDIWHALPDNLNNYIHEKTRSYKDKFFHKN